MKKIITILAIAMGVLIVIIAITGMLLPKDYSLERSVVVGASAETIFPHVNDLTKNEAWSPWEQDDETIKTTYGEIVEGVGATSSWTSEKSGNGTMKISESTPYTSITTELDFGEMGTATAKWSFEEMEEGTKVTWNLTGESVDFIGKFFGYMIDSFVGPQYEKGLNNLKQLVENQSSEK